MLIGWSSGYLRALKREPSGCWIWQGQLSNCGYPVVTYQGRKRRVHRLVLTVTGGEPPNAEAHARRTCGNRRCCRPDHLYWANPVEAAFEAATKGSHIRLTDVAVGAVRVAARAGVKQIDLAEAVGCGQSHISAIVRGKVRRRVQEP